MDNPHVIGKVENINVGPHFSNVTITVEGGKSQNLKLDRVNFDHLITGKIYQFEVTSETKADGELIYYCLSFQAIETLVTKEVLDQLYEMFYVYAPIKIKEIEEGILSFLKRISEPTLKTLTDAMYHKHQHAFYAHPAATKFHHAYVGGLSYHTLTMLKIADSFLPIYPYLNADLLFSGILLHDMSKIHEMTGVDGEYTKEGILIGHITMQAIEIDKMYHELNLQDEETLLLLKHMILSHHGLPNFGSAKKPQTAEALMLWYIDTIDSKFTVLGEELEKVKEGTFTNSIGVLDKMRFYKKK
jgi:3'-5' exoribonuclease